MDKFLEIFFTILLLLVFLGGAGICIIWAKEELSSMWGNDD